MENQTPGRIMSCLKTVMKCRQITCDGIGDRVARPGGPLGAPRSFRIIDLSLRVTKDLYPWIPASYSCSSNLPSERMSNRPAVTDRSQSAVASAPPKVKKCGCSIVPAAIVAVS